MFVLLLQHECHRYMESKGYKKNITDLETYRQTDRSLGKITETKPDIVNPLVGWPLLVLGQANLYL